VAEVIKIENLYKEYNLGVIGHGTLYRDIQSFTAKLRGKPDPNSAISNIENLNEINKNIKTHLALKNINISINSGEVVGVIGKNGAGKSSLLKILSRITAPSKGQIKIKGTVASLLEVGTGFHPELTGRENIYLNGAINGMNSEEVTDKLPDIIKFAGIEKYIDTPVKRYSSGMHVRLGFAVAAHIEPDILLVDEVLAVGDAEFQNKALNKMKDVTNTKGRTILFVSHNMASIKSLCDRVLLIEDGQIVFDDVPQKTINEYMKRSLENYSDFTKINTNSRTGNGLLKIKNIFFTDSLGNDIYEIVSGQDLNIKIEYETFAKIEASNFLLDVRIKDENGFQITEFSAGAGGERLIQYNDFKKNGFINILLCPLMLRAGTYYLDVFASVRLNKRVPLDYVQNIIGFNVTKGDYWRVGSNNSPNSYVLMDYKIEN